MEDGRGNVHKRNAVDIQEASDSSPVINSKKRRIQGSIVSTNSFPDHNSSHAATAENIDYREDIKKNVQVIRNYVESGSPVNEAATAIRTLRDILRIDEKKHAKVIVEEGAVSIIIQHLKMTSGADTLTAVVEIMDEWALKLLRALVENSDLARREIFDQEMIAHLLQLLRRRHAHADAELIHRLQLATLHVFGELSRRAGEETVRALLDLQNDGTEFRLALVSPNSKVQLSALHVIRDLVSTNFEYVNSISDQTFVCQLTVLLSSIHTEVRIVTASTILAMLSNAEPDLKELFYLNGVSFDIAGLLKSNNDKCRSIGAKLLHIFVTEKPILKSVFNGAGALRHLVQMLSLPNLQRDAIIALHSVATLREDVSCGIVREGGLKLVSDLFVSPDVQRDPVLAPIVSELFSELVTSTAGLVPFIKSGGVRLLRTAKLYNETSRTTITPACWTRLSMQLHYSKGHRARAVCNAIKESDDAPFIERARCVHALALWSDPVYFLGIFVFYNFLEIVLELFASDDPNDQYDGAEALYSIASESLRFLLKDHSFGHWEDDPNVDVSDNVDEAYFLTRDFSGQPQDPPSVQVPDIGLRYLNNPNYDITFLLDDKTKQFQAHQCVLSEASDVFRALLSGKYNDIVDGIVEVHDIKHSTFVSVMQFVYTGRLQYSSIDDVYAILEAAQFYGLHCLKKVCEYLIAREHMVVENVAQIYEFAEWNHSKLLMHICILFILEFHEQVRSLPSYRTLVKRIIPEIRVWFPTIMPGYQSGSGELMCGF